jgi:hypothetical protein
MLDLNDLIKPGTGWVLATANGINDAGEIAGSGTYYGSVRAFVLSPAPEPSAGVLMTVGGAFLAARRRRRGAGQ